jgi:hypothetical protein
MPSRHATQVVSPLTTSSRNRVVMGWQIKNECFAPKLCLLLACRCRLASMPPQQQLSRRVAWQVMMMMMMFTMMLRVEDLHDEVRDHGEDLLSSVLFM